MIAPSPHTLLIRVFAGMSARPITTLLMAIALGALILASCQRTTSTPAMSGEEGLIWEAWTAVQESYVAADSVDSEQVSNAIIASMLQAADETPYPFLTELDQGRRRLPRGVPRDLGNVWKAWELMGQRRPDVSPHLLASEAVRGLIDGLDDRSTLYLTPEDYDRAREEPSTIYEGIGAYISVVEGQIVLSPMLGGPAERAGIQRGDVLVAVDGETITRENAEQVTGRVKGPAGTKIDLSVMRDDETRARVITVVRSHVDLPSVEVSLLPGAIGLIYIANFKQSTPLEVLDVLERLQQADMLGLILDLRANPGGPVELAAEVASQFVAGGVFVSEIDQRGRRTQVTIEEGGIATADLPMAVLVNETTADSAEALAGALQDTGRAKVVGMTTFGHGSATSYVELSDGSAIQLATARWHTPLNRPISGAGIVPDLQVPLTAVDLTVGRDAQLGQAYQYLDDLLPPFR